MQTKDRGSSILFVLIIMATMSVMTYVAIELFSQAIATQRKAAAKVAYLDFIRSTRALLSDAQMCETLLRGQRITTGGLNRNSQNRNLVIGLGQAHLIQGGQEIRANNTSLSNLFEITESVISVYQSEIIRTDGNTPDHPLRVLQYDRQHNVTHAGTGTSFNYGNDFWSYKVRIQFNARLKGTLRNFYLNTMNDTHPEYWIELIANVNSNGYIFTCHGLEHIAEACEVKGGAYDASAFMNSWPELRCHPANDLCWPGPQVFTTIAVALPGNPQQPNCPWPYTDITWAGRVSGQDKWICTWCNNKRWNPPHD